MSMKPLIGPGQFFELFSGPKSGGEIRWCDAASYAAAILNKVGSPNGRARKSIPTGSFAGTGPTRRVPPRAFASRTRSKTWVVNPAGTVIAGKPIVPSNVH